MQNSLSLLKKLPSKYKYKDDIENEMVICYIPLLISLKTNSCNNSILYAKIKGSNEVLLFIKKQESNYFNKATNSYKTQFVLQP